jgi:hypothetical protein
MPIPLIWIGTFLMVIGVVYLATQALWRGRLSEVRRARSGGVTLEPTPREATGGFSLQATWPGLLLIAIGVLLFLAAAWTGQP